MGKIVYVSLGSNMGDRQSNLSVAVRRMNEIAGKVMAVSSIYITPPWGFEAELDFFNICTKISTDYPAEELLRRFKVIETEMGRTQKSTEGYTSRIIDLDVLTIESETVDFPELTIPHPRMNQRKFVLHPLFEIAPDFIHPISGKPIQQLMDECLDESNPKIHESKISWNE